MASPATKDLLEFHYECLLGMYFSQYRKVGGGALLLSDLVTDSYYNFFAPDDAAPSDGVPPTLMEEFISRQRKPAVYRTPLAPRHDTPPSGDVWAQDAWLVGDVAALDATVRSETLTVDVIGRDRRDAYVETFEAAYSGDDPSDPYGRLDEGYLRALSRSFDTDAAGYRKYYLLASAGDETVGVAVLFTKGGLAGVYGVGTKPQRRQQGIGTALMASMTGLARRDGAEWILLQTEAGSAVQRWYQTLGYQDAFTATYVTFEVQR